MQVGCATPVLSLSSSSPHALVCHSLLNGLQQHQREVFAESLLPSFVSSAAQIRSPHSPHEDEDLAPIMTAKKNDVDDSDSFCNTDSDDDLFLSLPEPVATDLVTPPRVDGEADTPPVTPDMIEQATPPAAPATRGNVAVPAVQACDDDEADNALDDDDVLAAAFEQFEEHHGTMFTSPTLEHAGNPPPLEEPLHGVRAEASHSTGPEGDMDTGYVLSVLSAEHVSQHTPKQLGMFNGCGFLRDSLCAHLLQWPMGGNTSALRARSSHPSKVLWTPRLQAYAVGSHPVASCG